jgi:CheY-like chemotaxis protein
MPRSSPPLVLIVDDDPDSLEILTDLCRAAGFASVACSAGREGMRRALVERPQVILLDVHMPNLDGLSLLRELGADLRTRHIPVVLVTADHTEVAARRARELGCRALLHKPIDAKMLTATIAAILQPRPTARA